MTNLRTDEIAFSGSLTKIGTDENRAIIPWASFCREQVFTGECVRFSGG